MWPREITSLHSMDGVKWTRINSYVPKPNLLRVIFANGRFVAVGGAYYRSGSHNSIIAVFTDGHKWGNVLNHNIVTPPNERGETSFF